MTYEQGRYFVIIEIILELIGMLTRIHGEFTFVAARQANDNGLPRKWSFIRCHTCIIMLGCMGVEIIKEMTSFFNDKQII